MARRPLQAVDAAEDPPGGSGTGGRNGNGGLTRYRLDEVERRMGTLEGEVRELVTTCTRIETKLDEIASKSYVWRIFGRTAVFCMATILVHLLIQFLTSSGSGSG